jgi:hypothetical protein
MYDFVNFGVCIAVNFATVDLYLQRINSVTNEIRKIAKNAW